MFADGVGVLLEKEESSSESHLLANGLQVSCFPQNIKPGSQTCKIQFAVSSLRQGKLAASCQRYFLIDQVRLCEGAVVSFSMVCVSQPALI
jgi:hypothetical protein